jgi:hypothetical protein
MLLRNADSVGLQLWNSAEVECCCLTGWGTRGTESLLFAVELVWRSCCGVKKMWIDAFVDTSSQNAELYINKLLLRWIAVAQNTKYWLLRKIAAWM